MRLDGEIIHIVDNLESLCKKLRFDFPNIVKKGEVAAKYLVKNVA